jgi:Protein of unknown function (DUF2955)
VSSAAAALDRAFPLDPASVLRRRQIFRLSFGMTLSAAIAFSFAWPLSFITPVFAAKLLVSPRALPLKAQAGFLVLLKVGLVVGTEVFLPILAYPSVFLLLSGLTLFLLFYARASGAPPLLVVFLLIGVIVVPLVGTINPSLARSVADGLFFSAAIAIVTVNVSGALIPDPSGLAVVEKAEPSAAKDSSRERALLALRSVVVLYPLFVLFMLYSAVGGAVALIFAMMLTLEPTYGAHLKAGAGLILANLSGGMVAVIIYQLLVFVPSYPFFLILVTASGLLIGNEVFSDTKLGKLLSAGITAVFIVLGPTVTGDAAAGANLALRLALIAAGVIYVVLAFGLLERLTRGKRRSAA